MPLRESIQEHAEHINDETMFQQEHLRHILDSSQNTPFLELADLQLIPPDEIFVQSCNDTLELLLREASLFVTLGKCIGLLLRQHQSNF